MYMETLAREEIEELVIQTSRKCIEEHFNSVKINIDITPVKDRMDRIESIAKECQVSIAKLERDTNTSRSDIAELNTSMFMLKTSLDNLSSYISPIVLKTLKKEYDRPTKTKRGSSKDEANSRK